MQPIKENNIFLFFEKQFNLSQSSDHRQTFSICFRLTEFAFTGKTSNEELEQTSLCVAIMKSLHFLISPAANDKDIYCLNALHKYKQM